MAFEPCVGRILTTPAGNPAFSRTRTNSRAVRGVFSEGLRMLVQPAASAGPTLRPNMATGKFQGLIR